MIGNSLNSLGSTNYRLGRFAEARPFLEEARVVRARAGDRAGQGESTNMLALTLARLGEPDSAQVLFDQALALTVAAGDSARTGNVLTNYMTLLMDQGRLGAAVRLGERATTIQQDLGNAAAAARIQGNMGELFRQQGRFADASDRLAAAVQSSRESSDAAGLLATLVLLGKLAVSVGDVDLGRSPLLEAVRLADSLGDGRRHTEALIDLAELTEVDGDLTGAMRYATAAGAEATDLGDATLEHDVARTLGGLSMALGDTSGTRSWYARAEASGRSLSVEVQASDLHGLGIAATYGNDLESAAKAFRRALETAEQAHAPDLAWPPLLGLGEVAERRADFAAALAYDRRAATLIDTLRSRQGEEAPSIAVLAERRFAFEALIHLLTRLQGRFPDSAFVAEAFAWSERARARALEDLLEASGRHAQRIVPVSLDQVRTEMPPRAAFLEYSAGDSSTSLWLVTRRLVRHFSLPPRGRLRSQVEILRRSLANPAEAESPTARRAARGLYETLLAPAELDLKGVDPARSRATGCRPRGPISSLVSRSPTCRRRLCSPRFEDRSVPGRSWRSATRRSGRRRISRDRRSRSYRTRLARSRRSAGSPGRDHSTEW